MVFCWILSHVGICGNERADFLAKQALCYSHFDVVFPFSVSDIKNLVEDIILAKWQDMWENGDKGRFYFNLEPEVSLRVKFSDPNKFKQTIITRLRFGKGLFNDILFLFKRHPTGLCSMCGVRETVVHVLLYCRKYTGFHRFMEDKLSNLGLEKSIVNILTNEMLFNDIFNFFIDNNIKV